MNAIEFSFGSGPGARCSDRENVVKMPIAVVAETCQNPRVAPYSWTVREGFLDGPVVMREYVYDVPDKEPVVGQELYLSNGSGPWRVSLREEVPEVPRSPYNILVVERVY